jgi:beta-lactamase superfamily II metal-dependent hydrolase
MKALAAASIGIALVAAVPQPKNTKSLDIYVADTEGGKAALFVSPSRETLLIDSGNPGGRDTERIVSMLNDAGVAKIDHLVSTHYHIDHVGGMPELAKRMPIAHYVDHGPSVEEKDQAPGFTAAYKALQSQAKHTVVKPGDRIPMAGIDVVVLTAAGQALKKPLAGAGRPNPACSESQKKEESSSPDENSQSVGLLITFGQFRAIDLGDLLWNKEIELMCPNNPVGSVDLYMVTHHGLDRSGSGALVHGVRPRVAVMQNGTRKGGSIQAYEIMRSSPGLEDIWQLHWSYSGRIEHNPPGLFIANIDEPETLASVLTTPPGQRGGGTGANAAHTPAYYLKISAQNDGSFTVTNTRNGFSKRYVKRSS